MIYKQSQFMIVKYCTFFLQKKHKQNKIKPELNQILEMFWLCEKHKPNEKQHKKKKK